MTLSVIIPVFNEAPTIAELLRKVQATGLAREIIVVDDGSSDATPVILKEFNSAPFAIVRLEKNQGKGSAIRAGLQRVSGDIVIIQDADLEYDPADYAALIEPIVSGKAAVVYGARKGLDTLPLNIFRLGRWFVTHLTNVLYGVKLSDEPCGYKVFRSDVLKGLGLQCRGFEFCPEATVKVIAKGLAIHEVPVNYHPRTARDGKKITFSDGCATIVYLIKQRFFGTH